MSMSIAPEMRSTSQSLSKLKPEQGRDVLKILSTLSATNLLQGYLWVSASPETKHRCQRAQTTQDEFQQSLSAQSEREVSLHSCLNPPNGASNTRSQKLPQWHELPCSLWKTRWFESMLFYPKKQLLYCGSTCIAPKTRKKLFRRDRSNKARSSTSFLQSQSCAIQAKRTTAVKSLMSNS